MAEAADDRGVVEMGWVSRRLGVSPGVVRRWVHANLFPKPRVIQPRRWWFAKSDVEQWLAAREPAAQPAQKCEV
jgi:excisionase family DNA binding protein